MTTITGTSEIGVAVDGKRIRAWVCPSQSGPALIALHGGAYTSRYYAVPGSRAGSFIDVAHRNCFTVITVDRPGYGASDPLADDQSTFARQAEILTVAIGKLLTATDAKCAILLGHSIGGMLALEIAATSPSWPLIGLALSGMGARLARSGVPDQLADGPETGMVDLPVEMRERAMFGPARSFTSRAREAARMSYSAAPATELRQARGWAEQRLAATAAVVTVPVHHAIGEFDALWDSSDDALAAFRAFFAPGHPMVSERVPGVGHSIDHHRMAAPFHLRQLAFSLDCVQRAGFV